jgi:hypothetical protein
MLGNKLPPFKIQKTVRIFYDLVQIKRKDKLPQQHGRRRQLQALTIQNEKLHVILLS